MNKADDGNELANKADDGNELANALLLAKSSSPKGMSTKPRESSNTSSLSNSRIWKEEQEEWSRSVSDMKPTEILYKKKKRKGPTGFELQRTKSQLTSTGSTPFHVNGPAFQLKTGFKSLFTCAARHRS
jgi:hypothetical protein